MPLDRIPAEMLTIKPGNQLALFVSTAASVTLTAADAGKTLYLAGSGAQSVTLPLGSTLVPGSTFVVYKYQGTATFTRSGTDLIDDRTSTITSFTLLDQEEIVFTWDGGAWRLVSGSAMLRICAVQANFPFGRVFNINGYQRLPSGLIIQWGQVADAASQSGTFPIAFPSGILHLGGTNQPNTSTITSGTGGQSTSSGSGVCFISYSLTGFTVDTSVGSSDKGVLKYLAVGY